MKELIVYYSRSGENYVNNKIVNLKIGNAKVIASKIKEFTKDDIYEIKSDRAYSNNYKECIKEALEDLNYNKRPKITSSDIDINNYDSFIIVYPNWWSDIPTPVYSFLEKYDFTNKTIIPICTHEGSELGKTVSTIKRLAHKAIVKTGLAIKGSTANTCDTLVKNYLGR